MFLVISAVLENYLKLDVLTLFPNVICHAFHHFYAYQGCLVNICSSYGLVPPGNKPSPAQVLIKMHVDKWYLFEVMSYDYRLLGIKCLCVCCNVCKSVPREHLENARGLYSTSTLFHYITKTVKMFHQTQGGDTHLITFFTWSELCRLELHINQV